MWPRSASSRCGRPKWTVCSVPCQLTWLICSALLERLVAERAVVGDAGVGDEQLEAAGALARSRRWRPAWRRRRRRRTRARDARRGARRRARRARRSSARRARASTPRAASAPASARPMPREAPVTNARVPGVTCMVAEPITMVRMTDHATVAEEEYLQTLFWLQEAGLPMTGANVARAMQLSPPTVHEMIGRLERDGYITRAGDKTISFTDTGAEHAEGVVRRHRLIERFLTDVLGIPWDEVHEEAERLEHAMSPVLEERMLAAIGDAKTCPHGHPIVAGTRIEGVPLADVEPGATVTGPAPGERGRGPPALPQGPGPRARPRRPRCARTTATRSCSTPAGTRCASCARSPRRSRSSPIRRRRRGSRCPSSSCSRATATGASASMELRGRVAIVTGGASGRRLDDRAAARRRGRRRSSVADVSDCRG